MRILIIDSYYPAFWKSHYAECPELSNRPYLDQWRALMKQCFGTANFYSENLKEFGHEATDVIQNCRPLQERWAVEHGLKLKQHWFFRRLVGIPIPFLTSDWMFPILEAQVLDYQPDIIHFHDPPGISPMFLRRIRPYVRLITTQISSSYPPGTSFEYYDLILSSFPHYVARFKSQGFHSAYFRLGFEPRILDRLKSTTQQDIVFVGGFSNVHRERIRLLEYLAESVPLKWYGYGIEYLSARSPLRATYHGPAWGMEMYQILYNSRISLNQHSEASENYANNMRLYEATGVGSLLLTDAKDNLAEMFIPGKEIATYNTPEECLDQIEYFLANEAERATIAQAGQQRTLTDHTYRRRMEEYLSLVDPLL